MPLAISRAPRTLATPPPNGSRNVPSTCQASPCAARTRDEVIIQCDVPRKRAEIARFAARTCTVA